MWTMWLIHPVLGQSLEWYSAFYSWWAESQSERQMTDMSQYGTRTTEWQAQMKIQSHRQTGQINKSTNSTYLTVWLSCNVSDGQGTDQSLRWPAQLPEITCLTSEFNVSVNTLHALVTSKLTRSLSISPISESSAGQCMTHRLSSVDQADMMPRGSKIHNHMHTRRPTCRHKCIQTGYHH